MIGFDGRPVKIVSIIDEHTCECLGGLVRRSITGEHLIAELSCLAAERRTFQRVLRLQPLPPVLIAAATNPQLATLAPAHTNERPSSAVHQFTGPATRLAQIGWALVVKC